ncbi:hypothetical protein BB561_001143 [Smittium simulii]|uniref:Uncharacterized protein n=1 Tax=Smittium simulii TaxID=133385 RepID=A0A2T9YVV9_9FUNG|nr:hypothetical protein BB561_001143 [Smittium simulii]
MKCAIFTFITVVFANEIGSLSRINSKKSQDKCTDINCDPAIVPDKKISTSELNGLESIEKSIMSQCIQFCVDLQVEKNKLDACNKSCVYFLKTPSREVSAQPCFQNLMLDIYFPDKNNTSLGLMDMSTKDNVMDSSDQIDDLVNKILKSEQNKATSSDNNIISNSKTGAKQNKDVETVQSSDTGIKFTNKQQTLGSIKTSNTLQDDSGPLEMDINDEAENLITDLTGQEKTTTSEASKLQRISLLSIAGILIISATYIL